MAATRKTTAKTTGKTAAKTTTKTAAKKPAKAAAAPARNGAAIRDPLTKSQLLTTLADNTGLTRKQTTAVWDELASIVQRHLKKGGAGVCTLPGLAKIKTVSKPARKARKGINPFTGEEAMFKAKPASTVVKIQPLKAMKEMV